MNSNNHQFLIALGSNIGLGKILPLEIIKRAIVELDKYEINGDYIESQAFAFLAIRSVENMPISFPSTTRCQKSSTGGTIVKNF